MYELFNQFLPSATSILEILEYYDYQINVNMGSEIKFAGKNTFFLNTVKM
jgi:hypothetical protein